MGKRTNPIGLRLSNGYNWSNEINSPYHVKGFDPCFKDKVAFVASHILKRFGYELSYAQPILLGFVCVLHLFVKGSVSKEHIVLVNRQLQKLFNWTFYVYYHDKISWMIRDTRQKALLRMSFSKFRFYLDNQFFFSSLVNAQFGMALVNSELVCSLIVSLLKKHNRHWLVFRFIKNIIGLNFSNNASLRGLRIKIAGKINGRSRKKTRVVTFGLMPLQTVSNNISYSYQVAVTKFGAFGVKVWMFKSNFIKD